MVSMCPLSRCTFTPIASLQLHGQVPAEVSSEEGTRCTELVIRSQLRVADKPGANRHGAMNMLLVRIAYFSAKCTADSLRA